ncbi:MAG TPA: BatA and WFA domain-containing protein [Candidatus Nanoarchaeia archaeon]|nr:BatA and WFA domain-containing protein [Candidatus Nanoarchaeia archaeon]
MAFQLGAPLGLLAFLSLIPFIIIYLIKPKPQKLKVPSLMFFLGNTKITTRDKLLKYLEKDLLFFIQLLVLSLLAFSIADPLITVKKDVISSNIVFVLDASASSKTIEGSKTRFEIGKEKIQELATTRNSLILIKSTPVLLLNDASKSELLRYLQTIQPTDDISDVAGAITLGGEILGERKGRVVAVSDFIPSKGINPEIARNVLESRGIAVDFIKINTEKRSNIGIINMILSDKSANIYIKNFNDKDENVKIKVNDETNEIKIAKGSVEPLAINLEGNGSEIKIENKDDFDVDNRVYIARPFSNKIKVLLITNEESKFIKAALKSIPDVELKITEPPIIDDEGYDIYIVDKVDPDKVLAGTFKELNGKAREGKPVVIAAQANSDKIDYEGLLPAKITNYTRGGQIKVNYVTRFSKDIDFGEIKYYFALDKQGLSAASVENDTIISIYENENGKVVYYGILEGESDFKLSPNYPIFWSNLIYYLVGRADINEINLRTGSIIEMQNEHFIMDKAGYFNVGSKRVAVNLLNEKESDINSQEEAIKKYSAAGQLEKVKSEVDYQMSFYALLIALALVVFEFFYIKIRGEV